MIPLRFESCSSFCIAGATKSGKTSWAYWLLKHKDVMFTEPVEKVLYCYGVYQPLFDEMIESISNVSFHKGFLSELDSFTDDSKHGLAILDDLVDDVVRETDMQKLFSQEAHHLRLSTLFKIHNCF